MTKVSLTLYNLKYCLLRQSISAVLAFVLAPNPWKSGYGLFLFFLVALHQSRNSTKLFILAERLCHNKYLRLLYASKTSIVTKWCIFLNHLLLRINQTVMVFQFSSKILLQWKLFFELDCMKNKLLNSNKYIDKMPIMGHP